VAWTINRERVVVLGWSAAVLMQLAHPLVTAGVAEHSVAVAQPRMRLRRARETIASMLALTFGPPDETARAARTINTIHDRVHGQLRAATGALPAGAPYSAHDPALLLWVHATLLDVLPRAYALYVGPLSAADRDRFCAEGVGMAAVVGIPEQDMPESAAALGTYLEGMMAGGLIAVGPAARTLAREMLLPPLGPLIYLPTVGLVPPSIRRAYGLRWTAGHQAALRASAWLIRRLLPLVSAIVRYWTAARVAMQRKEWEPERMHTLSRPKLGGLTGAHDGVGQGHASA